MSRFNQNWDCECGWTGHEDELESRCEFAGNREEPPEYSASCPSCGCDWERMTESDDGDAIDGAEYMLAIR